MSTPAASPATRASSTMPVWIRSPSQSEWSRSRTSWGGAHGRGSAHVRHRRRPGVGHPGEGTCGPVSVLATALSRAMTESTSDLVLLDRESGTGSAIRGRRCTPAPRTSPSASLDGPDGAVGLVGEPTRRVHLGDPGRLARRTLAVDPAHPGPRRGRSAVGTLHRDPLHRNRRHPGASPTANTRRCCTPTVLN